MRDFRKTIPLAVAWLLSAGAWLYPFFAHYGAWLWLEFDTGRELATLQVLGNGGSLYTDIISWYGPVAYFFAGIFVQASPFPLLITAFLFQLTTGLVLSLLLFHSAARWQLPPLVAALLPGAYAAIAAINLDGTSFLFPYSLAATFSLPLLLAFILTLHRFFQRTSRLDGLLLGLAAGTLASVKQDYLPALGLMFICGLVWILLADKRSLRPFDLVIPVLTAAGTFFGWLLVWFGTDAGLFRTNWLNLEMIRAFYPNGSLYEALRAYSPPMMLRFAAAAGLMVLLRHAVRIPQPAALFAALLLGVFAALGPFPKAWFYTGPFVVVATGMFQAIRNRTLPAPDPFLLGALLLVFMHSRQGTMNELYQAGGLLYWAWWIFRTDGISRPVAPASVLLFLAVFMVARTFTAGERLNEPHPRQAVETSAGVFHLSTGRADVLERVLPELERRKSGGLAYGQEAGWLEAATGVPSAIRDRQWWQFSETRIVQDLEAAKPGALALVYFRGRADLHFFSGMNGLSAYIRSQYRLSISETGGGMTIEIWDRITAPDEPGGAEVHGR